MAVRADRARLILLCERLTDATAAGTTEWRGQGDDHFRWERAEGAVSIGARDRDGQPPYELAVFNPGGERVEEVASALVDDDRPAEWNEPLAELYRVARRSALHADEIIESLMQALPPSATEAPTAIAPAADLAE
jgi:ankyrin repeat protein